MHTKAQKRGGRRRGRRTRRRSRAGAGRPSYKTEYLNRWRVGNYPEEDPTHEFAVCRGEIEEARNRGVRI